MKYYQPTDIEVAVRMVAQALRDYKKKHKKFVEQLPKIKFGVVNETTVWIIGVILLEKSMKKLHSMKRKEIKSLRRCRMKELARDVN